MLSTQGQVIECLLRGDFICRTSAEEAWQFLQDDARRQQVDDYLAMLNRKVSVVGGQSDGDVYFCSWRQLGDAERRSLTQQLRDVHNALTPLVEWLVLVQTALAQDAPLTEGSALRLNELQGIVEETPAFREQLTRISHYRLFGSTSPQVDMQIKQVFKRLCELGYLLRPNSEKQIYLGTGKLEYLYELIRFIDESEGLTLEQRAEVASQGSLL